MRVLKAAPSVLSRASNYGPFHARAFLKTLEQPDPESCLGLVAVWALEGFRASLAFAQILPTSMNLRTHNLGASYAYLMTYT